ncbi:hypothetical protein HRJ35_16745 [Shewanella oneidensis MR-1]|uniref:Uncharacterized protein n=1 Tax=Shewanella oneidensis (strain ATCC 700550 / JCM 31522 / CIP 106686 / LMG 19005 / NCIMB 14063 / MR-1) TaxID=211586 RepID=Q8ECT6_SHEON|nr:hypothetical protein [Shewanella oneidensis]AAN56055.2 uncharacterized protein SO_3045 [Shewanella oneidensis MR-1]MDX5999511.1 hypothetical protein [Shewanella oneidensis]MEE2028185.1 hypothetical protein [Shewanella oneidensis]QKG98625.1 hypothetical protein HRJ35_16745 [Shewanella oneidensis MR-1]
MLKVNMGRIDISASLVKETLDSYREDFVRLVRDYAHFSYTQGDAYCDFFVDVTSMMNGVWLLTADLKSDSIEPFQEFNWSSMLNIYEEYTAEDELIALLQTTYKIGYLWLIEQLSLLKQQIDFIELRLYHNGSLDYQALS